MSITLNGSVADIISDQMKAGNYQSPEDLIYEAIEALVKQKIESGINDGLADLESGCCMELRTDTIGEVLSKPLSEW
ncbi:MAG: hypothetical protein COA42_05215 [Alteromonadaceae bacterium]|nr:MAG: hypothetical protein COA42_05215 [Alteromonadaceae bacterium]